MRINAPVGGSAAESRLRAVFRAGCFFAAYLLALEVVAAFLNLPGPLQRILRLIPFCLSAIGVGYLCRPIVWRDRRSLFIVLILGCVLALFLTDCTGDVRWLDGVPLLGGGSSMRRPFQMCLGISATFVFFAASYSAINESDKARAQMTVELQKLIQAEESLRRQIGFDELVTAILARLTSYHGMSIEEGIRTALGELALFTGAESAFLVMVSGQAKVWRVAHQYCRPGLTGVWHQANDASLDSFPWTASKLQKGEPVIIRGLGDYPPEAFLDHHHAAACGIQSVLNVPLLGPRSWVNGCLGLQAMTRKVDWVEEDLRGLRMVGEAIGNALERNTLEAQLRQAQKMEAFGQMAGGIAHDFNNLLTVIQATASLVQMEGLASTERSAAIDEIITISERAAALTRQLLTFSRQQVAQPRALDLNEVTTNLIKMLRRMIGEHIVLDAELAGESALIYADLGMMEQVFMNLAVNARDAMGRGGQLTIKLSVVDLDPESHAGHAKNRCGRFVCTTVRDSGSGIRPEHLPHIFEPFFTTKESGKGTGLGLATVGRIIEQHNGWIEVQSQLGLGSEFRVFLPYHENSSSPLLASGTFDLPLRGNATILLVEDEDSVRILARRHLELYGYRVFEASSGPEALGVWEANGQSVDLLLTDLIMPGGMTGLELAQRLRADRPLLRVVYSTGYSQGALESHSLPDPGPDVLPLKKPYGPKEMLSVVRRALQGSTEAVCV